MRQKNKGMKKTGVLGFVILCLLSGCAQQSTEATEATTVAAVEAEALETVELKRAEVGDIVQMGTYEQDGDPDTKDKIFLLSWKEAEQYYGNRLTDASGLGRKPSRAVLQKREAIFTDIIIEELPAMYPYSRHLPDGTHILLMNSFSTCKNGRNPLHLADYAHLVGFYDSISGFTPKSIISSKCISHPKNYQYSPNVSAIPETINISSKYINIPF